MVCLLKFLPFLLPKIVRLLNPKPWGTDQWDTVFWTEPSKCSVLINNEITKRQKTKKRQKPIKSQLQHDSAHFVIAHLLNKSIETYIYEFTKIATVQKKEQKHQKATESFWTTDPNSMLLWPAESKFLPQTDYNITFFLLNSSFKTPQTLRRKHSKFSVIQSQFLPTCVIESTDI